MEFPIRLNKYLAHAGFATRRSADTLIAEGGVLVNGIPAHMGQKITATDKVTLKKTSSTQTFTYILYYKPLGVYTHSPEGDGIDIATRIKKDHRITDVFPIGRIDKNTEGLIILTNDGRVTNRILTAENHIEQEYIVHVDKRITNTFLNRLAKGVRIGEYMTNPATVKLINEEECTFSIALTEGRKHHIRRMCATLGYNVTALVRTRIGNFSLRKLKSGEVHTLKGKEITFLQKELGLK